MFKKVTLFLCIAFGFGLISNIEGNTLRFKRQWFWGDQTPRTTVITPTTPSTTPPTTPSTTTISSNTDSSGLNLSCQAACLRSTTNEYNPVCGSDNVTYDNPSKLRCASSCGKATLSMDYYGPCV